MSSQFQELSIEIDEWPSREDIQDFISSSNSHEAITDFIVNEFDTFISCRVGDLDLLSGYPEAFILPLHAFARELSKGIKVFDQQGKATIPLYLQQYNIAEGDPSHSLILTHQNNNLHMALEWGGENAPPTFLKEWEGTELSYGQVRKEILGFLDEYSCKVAMLLGPQADWTGEDISKLFKDF